MNSRGNEIWFGEIIDLGLLKLFPKGFEFGWWRREILDFGAQQWSVCEREISSDLGTGQPTPSWKEWLI
jgi:hypothetical protein